MTSGATDEDQLRPDELVPAAGGEWGGSLYENPATGYAMQLTWSFSFPFEEVSRSYGGSPVSLDIEWMPGASVHWSHMAGQRLTSSRFAEPAEASVYFFEHHRFDQVDVHLVEQRDHTLRVVAAVSGDIDGLGIERIEVEAWLRFTGIFVSVSDARSPNDALGRLGEFTDTDGLHLSGDTTGTAVLFVPGSG